MGRLIGYQPLKPCAQCQLANVEVLEFSCAICRQLFDESTLEHGQIFTLLRQWRHVVQSRIDQIITKALEQRTVKLNSFDAVTGQTLLHYACKAGAKGVGNPTAALEAVKILHARGASDVVTSRWTEMLPLHFAVYFNSPDVVKYILEQTDCRDLQSRCGEYFSATPLHLAALSLSYESAKVLLNAGADPGAVDNLGLTPADVAEAAAARQQHQPSASDVSELLAMLKIAQSLKVAQPRSQRASVTVGDVALAKRGLCVGDRVRVKDGRFGTVRSCSEVHFASGYWAGIELDSAQGSHNGTVDGVVYFACPPHRGLMVPLQRLQKLVKPSETKFGFIYTKYFRTASVTETINEKPIRCGTEVLIASKQRGVVRFVGPTHFAPGLWYGIELKLPVGRNDGTIHGVRYFRCAVKHGIFAPPSKVKRCK